jgi:hypothetical protein
MTDKPRPRRATRKQQLIEKIIAWRQQMKGSVSEHNHRRILQQRREYELNDLWKRIVEGEGTVEWKMLVLPEAKR